MVPSIRDGADQGPEGHERFDPTGPLNPADVDGPGPSELFQDPDDFLLRGRIVPGDQHLRRAPDELRVDHLRVGHRVEGLHDLRLRKGPLDSFRKRVVESDEETGVRSPGEFERILHVDDDFARKVLGLREPNFTSCPRLAKPRPSAWPTSALPKTPTRMGRGGRPFLFRLWVVAQSTGRDAAGVVTFLR